MGSGQCAQPARNRFPRAKQKAGVKFLSDEIPHSARREEMEEISGST
jgi:hypothetical protein